MSEESVMQEIIADAAHDLAKQPVEDWAAWVLYLLEILDSKNPTGFRCRPRWLDDIRDSANDRMTHGRW